MTPLHAKRELAAALAAEDWRETVPKVAITARDEGVAQLALYRVFVEAARDIAPDDDRYEAVIDTAEFIYGGAWAKGHDLYAEPLVEVRGVGYGGLFPAHWAEVAGVREALDTELARELGPGHPLFPRNRSVFARRRDNDDIAVLVDGGPNVAIVHLTWSRAPEPPPYPLTRVFCGIEELLAELEDEHV